MDFVYKYEPPHGKTSNLPRRKQRRRTAKLISTFVFAIRIVQFRVYLNLKFQASSSFLCLCRLFCVGPVRKPYCWFSHEAVQSGSYISTYKLMFLCFLNMIRLLQAELQTSNKVLCKAESKIFLHTIYMHCHVL